MHILRGETELRCKGVFLCIVHIEYEVSGAVACVVWRSSGEWIQNE